MRKSDLINNISDKTGIPKVDVLVTVETLLKEIKENIAKGENIYIRGFGSFITKNALQKLAEILKKILQCIYPSTTFLHLNLLKNL